MTTILSNSAAQIILDQYEKAAHVALRRLAPEYGIDPNAVFLSFDYTRGINWELKRGDRVEITCGISPANMKAFVETLRSALKFAQDKKMRNCVAIESVNTINSRNQRYVEMYDRMRPKKLIPQSQLMYRKFMSIMVLDTKSGESVIVSGEDVNIWDLQSEAHILLSKKVLGE